MLGEAQVEGAAALQGPPPWGPQPLGRRPCRAGLEGSFCVTTSPLYSPHLSPQECESKESPMQRA